MYCVKRPKLPKNRRISPSSNPETFKRYPNHSTDLGYESKVLFERRIVILPLLFTIKTVVIYHKILRLDNLAIALEFLLIAACKTRRMGGWFFCGMSRINVKFDLEELLNQNTKVAVRKIMRSEVNGQWFFYNQDFDTDKFHAFDLL